MITCDVLVVGGGHSGLLLAGALARQGFDARLLEQQPRATIMSAAPDGRSLALLSGSVDILHATGLWPALAAETAAIERVEVVDVAGGGRVRYDSAAHGDRPFGVGIEHAVLRRCLLTAFLDAAGEDGWIEGEITAIERDGTATTARLADGRAVRAALIVGADGRGSRVRSLARISVDRWSYGQQAITLVLDLPHAATVREWLRPGGPLATLPLPRDRTGITWVEPSAEAARLASLPRPALLAMLAEATGGVLAGGDVASGPATHPLGAQHARRYVAPRLALVGDAAHGVHPIHAQGFNMGIADVGALAEALSEARGRGRDLGAGEALLAYSRRRRGDNTQRLWLTDGMVRLFTSGLLPVRAARSLALGAIDVVPPLKRLAVRHGMQGG